MQIRADDKVADALVRIHVAAGNSQEANREWRRHYQRPKYCLPDHSTLDVPKTGLLHPVCFSEDFPNPTFAMVMIHPFLRTVIVRRTKDLHLYWPFRPCILMVDEVAVKTLQHCFVVVVTRILFSFPRAALSNLHYVKEDAEALTCGY